MCSFYCLMSNLYTRFTHIKDKMNTRLRNLIKEYKRKQPKKARSMAAGKRPVQLPVVEEKPEHYRFDIIVKAMQRKTTSTTTQ